MIQYVRVNLEFLRKVILINFTLRCVIPVVCVTNEREENIVEQHN